MQIIQAGRYDNKSTAEERDEYLVSPRASGACRPAYTDACSFLQRALLEAGEDEVDEEDDVDEAEALNEAIARTEDERRLFTQMDRDRRAAEEASWYAAGNLGKMPERLIQEHELPEVYRMDHPKIDLEESVAEGSRRARNSVRYDDGMTEEQWLKVGDPAAKQKQDR